MTKSVNNILSKLSEQERKDRWSMPGEKNPNWKGGISIKYCKDCGDEINYGNLRCMTCSKIGSQNPFYGKSHTNETKEKLRNINKGRLPSNTNPIVLDGVFYVSQAEAAEKLGVSIGSISNWITGKFKRRRAS